VRDGGSFVKGNEGHEGVVADGWVWLARWCGGAGNPSLRLKSGSVQDDNVGV
jgi:hypothetical protein